MFKTLIFAVALTLPLVTAAFAKTGGVSLKDQRLFACQDDLRRLCSGAGSDRHKLRTCIKPKKALVSATCRAWLNVPQSQRGRT